MKKPNVILISIDALRSDRLGSYGRIPSLTPNLDRLASRSIRFDQAISGGSWTQAAFPVMLTSTYASMYGGCLGKLAEARPSPIQNLAEAGYHTSGFSTSPLLSRDYGFDRGFDEFFDLVPDESDPFLRKIKGGQRLLRYPLTHHALGALGQPMRPARIYSSAGDVIDKVTEWITDIAEPFFSWIHFMDIHWPYHLEESLKEPSEIANAWNDMSVMHLRANLKIDKPITPVQEERFIQLYEESLRYLDNQLGRLLDTLEKEDRQNNTVIVIVSDHGEEFLEHGRWGHWESNLFDEVIRVPFYISMPNLDKPVVITDQVRMLDLMPTILDVCGCELPDGVLGTSLTPLWQSGKADYDETYAITEMKRDDWHRVSIRTPNYKLVWDSKSPDDNELYDLLRDPDELIDVSDLHPDVTIELRSVVDSHLKQVSDTGSDSPPQLVDQDPELYRRLRDLGYVE